MVIKVPLLGGGGGNVDFSFDHDHESAKFLKWAKKWIILVSSPYFEFLENYLNKEN